VVDNRSAGVLGIGGALNFKSGDISGTAAKTSDDRASQGTEYFAMEDPMYDQQRQEPFVDRSAQLKATLNSLAMMNVANIIKSKMINTDVKVKNEEEEKKNKNKKKNEFYNMAEDDDDDEGEIDYIK